MENTINEIIIKKIDKSGESDNIKNAVKDFLHKERENILTRYIRFSDDYDLIISNHTSGDKNDKDKKNSSE